MWKPKYFHIMTRKSVAMTYEGSANHSPPTPSRPTEPRTWSASPESGAKTMLNSTPVIASDRT